MRALVNDLTERNGPDSAADLVIALAGLHVAALDSLARRTGTALEHLVDELELQQLEGI
ncbi:hypothetical protein [Arthrobacter sp. ISL-5]|uniref:hypothetical protein n=1 Tax=Arthrobacter sp. ISL-5 TaxID=2819111 RepID=UPI001BE9EB9B|nr:hypothetical protein [Arthrobacter sp. ISL-5]MBT2555268.1 hypothetical protein [Arthrobacter sp. ISL-5]